MFIDAVDKEFLRRRMEQMAREQRELHSRALTDHVEREIALLMRQEEVNDEHRAGRERLRGLIQEHARDADLGLSERAQVAFARALAQGNHSALEALEREIGRQFEDEEHAVFTLLLH
jgi:tRNA A37 methylthiotransferase MiaB